MNNDNKVETAIAGLNCWASCATAYNLDFQGSTQVNRKTRESYKPIFC